MRRDAEARRQLLIEAAADCFAESGYSVPLEEIADRAGVGRGTLYRNFKDRMALALAIFEREIDEIGASAGLDLPLDAVLALMVEKGAKVSALFARIAGEMPLSDQANLAAFRALGARFEASLRPIVDKAHAEGRLRPELGAEALVLALRMLGALRSPHKPADDAQKHVAAALGLIMTGLAPR